MKEIVGQRQRGAGILKRAGWVLYHRSELRTLIQDITNLIDTIEKLFPAHQSQLTAVKSEIARLRDEQSLKLVKDAAHGIDPLLETAINTALNGHQYLNIMVKGRVHAGDTFSDNWHGRPIGALHT